MKLKSKLVLAASSLLVLSGAAMGTGAYAWFTATQAATVDFNNIAVKSNVDALSIAVTPTDTTNIKANAGTTVAGTNYQYYASKAAAADGEETAAANLEKLTDVSGNGINFYKAGLNDSGVVSSATAVAADKKYTLPYSYDFTVTFSHTNYDATDGQAMAIFLSPAKSAINLAGTTDKTGLAGATRIAITNQARDAVLCYYAPNDGIIADDGASDQYKYISAVTGSTATLTAVNATYENKVVDSSITTDVNDANTHSGTFSTPESNGYLLTLAKGTQSATVHVTIWFEGQDSDCVNVSGHDALAQSIDASVVFNGVFVNA